MTSKVCFLHVVKVCLFSLRYPTARVQLVCRAGLRSKRPSLVLVLYDPDAVAASGNSDAWPEEEGKEVHALKCLLLR